MSGLPDGRPGRVLALGVLALLLALGWLVLGAPLASWYGARAEELRQRSLLADHMAGLVAALPALREAARQGARDPEAGALVAGASDAVAGAALQQRVQDIAQQAGAQLSSIEMLTATQVGAYRRIGVRVALHATWPVVLRLMEAAETSRPVMLATDLQLHAQRSVDPATNPTLDGSLAIVGFRAGRAP